MNAQARLATLLVGNSARVRTAAVTLALALVSAASLAACGGIGTGNQAGGHACADKLAQASISGSVPGLWNCLTPDFQAQLGGTGGDGSLVPQPFATKYVLLGATANEASYEIALDSAHVQSQGFHYMALVVWLDRDGKISSFSTGSSPN